MCESFNTTFQERNLVEIDKVSENILIEVAESIPQSNFINKCTEDCQFTDLNNFCNISVSMQCPFVEFGCVEINQEIQDHMNDEIHNHNRILIDLIGNLNNEVKECKTKLNKHTEEFAKLTKKTDQINNEVNVINQEITSFKTNSINMKQETEVKTTDLLMRVDEVETEIVDGIVKEQSKNFQTSLINRKTFQEIKADLDEKLLRIKVEKENFELKISDEIKDLDAFLNLRDDGSIKWQLGPINKINYGMSSDIFYDKRNPYKLGLILCNNHDRLEIFTLIHHGAFDEDLQWPCHANVNIVISSFDVNNNKIEISKLLEIPRPAISSCESSDPICFLHEDLEKSELFTVDCFLKCKVSFS